MVEGAEYDQAIVRIYKEFDYSLKCYKKVTLQDIENILDRSIDYIYQEFLKRLKKVGEIKRLREKVAHTLEVAFCFVV